METAPGIPYEVYEEEDGVMIIGDDWLPTAENINALPKPLFEYIYHLETMADPAGMVAENALLKDQTRQLDAMIARLKRGGSTDG